MTEHATSVAVARAFTEAWTSHDLDTAGSYLTEDVVFDGPLGHVNGKKAYLESLNGLTQALGVNGARVVAVFGDDTQALIMYELITGRFGVLTCAKLLSMRDGKIQSDRLTFDSYEIRKAQGR
ncbi:MAG TPA: nuclear transport factor 2 family protein [Ktedonobacterales bacterium]|nr:nuclear transport factor 2 family protein [Ktedonobacterales bacterium]